IGIRLGNITALLIRRNDEYERLERQTISLMAVSDDGSALDFDDGARLLTPQKHALDSHDALLGRGFYDFCNSDERCIPQCRSKFRINPSGHDSRVFSFIKVFAYQQLAPSQASLCNEDRIPARLPARQAQ